MTTKKLTDLVRDYTPEQVAELAGEVISHRLEIERLDNKCKREQDATRKEYDVKTAPLKKLRKSKEAQVEAWAKLQPRSNGQPLSWTFPRAVVRLITGQSKVVLKFRVKLVDVVEKLQALPWGGNYLRTPEPEFDKEALLRDRKTIDPEAVADLGVRIAQDDELHIDAPKADKATAKEAA
ncbi:MAG: host-nuclease inhibitor Gam family protein [Lentisphaerae bacterium]|nr:host-nuclease inhibitor Gam family protein [Lentisphaerota bacterium]